MKKKKKVIAYMLVVCMMAGLLQTTTFAEEEHEYLEESTEEITGNNEESDTEEVTDDNEQSNAEEVTDDNEQDDTEEVTDDNEQGDTEEVTNDNEQSNAEEVTDDNEQDDTEEVKDDNEQNNTGEQDTSDIKDGAEEITDDNEQNSAEEQDPNDNEQEQPTTPADETNTNHLNGTKLTEALTNEGNSLQSGNYYLDEDLNIGSSLTIDGTTVKLCLNGTLSANGGNFPVIDVRDGGNLTLCECSGGTIKGGTHGVFVSNMTSGGENGKSSKFIMKNGKITGNAAVADNGGGVRLKNSSFTMEGGTITGNTASYGGGGVFVHEGSTISVSGDATITANTLDGITASNVYLAENQSITVKDDFTGKIGVTMGNPPTSESESKSVTIATGINDTTRFISDNDDYAIKLNGNTIELTVDFYTVTFENDDGTFIDSQKVLAGETAKKLPTDPTKTGYTFAGWFIKKDDDVEEAYDFDSEVTENITLTAKWNVGVAPAKKYNISGTVKYSDGTPIPNAAVEVKKVPALAIAPLATTRTNSQGKYTFSNLSKGQQYKVTVTITDDGGQKTASKDITILSKDVTVDIEFVLDESPVTPPGEGEEPPEDPTEEDLSEEIIIPEHIVQPGELTPEEEAMQPGDVIVEVEPNDEYSDDDEEFEEFTVEGLEEEAESHVDANTAVKLTSKVTVANAAKVDDIKFPSVSIQKEVKAITSQAYASNKKTTIVIPSVVKTKIKKDAFAGTKTLKTVLQIKTTKITTVVKGTFKAVSKKAMIKVPKNKVKTFAKKLKKAGFKGQVKLLSETRMAKLASQPIALQNTVALNQMAKLTGEPALQYYASQYDYVPYDDDDEEVEETDLIELDSEPTTFQDGTYWIDGYDIHIYTNDMDACYVVVYEDPEEEEKEDTKQKSGRTGSWVKDQKTDDTQKADTQKTDTQTTDIQNNETNITENKIQYDNCTKDSNCPLTKFVDMNVNEWYHDGVHYCVENGLMSGVSNTQFAPNQNATRAMIVAILWRIENNPSVDYDINFDDVSENAYYNDAVRWAVHAGIVSGYNEKTFAPNDSITREQIASILYRYAQYKGKDVNSQNVISNFEDTNNISSYAINAMNWACSSDIINGISSTELSPKGNATRAQIAQMLNVYLNQ